MVGKDRTTEKPAHNKIPTSGWGHTKFNPPREKQPTPAEKNKLNTA